MSGPRYESQVRKNGDISSDLHIAIYKDKPG